MIGKKIDILSHQSLYQSFKKAERSYFLPKVFYYCKIYFLYTKCNFDILIYVTYLINRNWIITFFWKRLSKCLQVLYDYHTQQNILIAVNKTYQIKSIFSIYIIEKYSTLNFHIVNSVRNMVERICFRNVMNWMWE